MKLSVLQWNVWFRESADKIIGEIKRLNADIVCLQELTDFSEANGERDIPAEIAALGYQPYYVHSLLRTETRMGNAIFSKYPLAHMQHTYVQREDPGSNDYSRENRIYLEVAIDVAGTRLTIGTVHLSYTDQFLSTPSKDAETDQLLAAIRPNTKRFILTGDLNALPDSYTIKQLDKLLVPAGPSYAKKTWTTKPFSYNGFNATGLDWRLDYVYRTPDVQVANSRIIQTTTSDHLPILTEIAIS